MLKEFETAADKENADKPFNFDAFT